MEKETAAMVPVTNPAGVELLHRLLEACVRAQASDMHLSSGRVPYLRVEGEIFPEPQLGALTAEGMESIIQAITAGMDPGDALKRTGAMDGSYSLPGGERFRFNLFRRQGVWCIALRQLERRFWSLEELGLPEALYRFCELRDGLVIVAGPAGSGKTTTMGTLIERITHKRKVRVITIEDPVEYLHETAMGVVDQRQVGIDAPSFNDALVCALRQDPDVIYFGEARDRNTIRTAMTAAETGHLVFTTVHAGDAVGAIERLVMTFSMEEQPSVRLQLAMVLRAVVVQHLLPAAHPREWAKPDNSGERPPPKRRLAACEVLINTPAIAHCIASGQGRQIVNFMEAGRSLGMQKLEQDVARLLEAQKISSATAAMAILTRGSHSVE